MRCQRSDAHALIGGVHNQLFLCQSLQCLLDRGIADLIFASKLLDVQLFSGLEYLRENIIFNILINLIRQGSFFTRCFVVLFFFFHRSLLLSISQIRFCRKKTAQKCSSVCLFALLYNRRRKKSINFSESTFF